MGKINWFKKRHKQPEMAAAVPRQEETPVQEKTRIEPVVAETALEQRKMDLKNSVDRQSYITQNCDQIMEATRQMEEFQKEYEAVTAYLSDIQVIDQIPEPSRKEVNEVARQILTLTRERNQYLNGKMKITKSQYDMMEMHEDEIPKEVQKISQKEKYLAALKGDLGTLEGEKHNLVYEQQEIKERHKFIQLISIVVASMTLIVFGVLFWAADRFYYDAKVPFIMTVLLALVCTAYIANEARKNKVEATLNQRKMARAIGLQNTVKIKFVNNKLSLDYSYAKFNINSSMQLAYYWEEYVKQKEINNKYKDNTELLNYYSEKLIRMLKGYYVHDPEVWLHQSIALLEAKEMVEIRHRLNVRRQKLRERMDYNMETKSSAISRINEVLKKYPEAKEEIISTLKKYHINL